MWWISSRVFAEYAAHRFHILSARIYAAQWKSGRIFEIFLAGTQCLLPLIRVLWKNFSMAWCVKALQSAFAKFRNFLISDLILVILFIRLIMIGTWSEFVAVLMVQSVYDSASDLYIRIWLDINNGPWNRKFVTDYSSGDIFTLFRKS